MNPNYPIYIPSKGRWETRFTVKSLEDIQVPYRVVIEKEEYDQYASVINPENILVLPFSNRGLIASRCWIMEHSIAEGHKRHWQFDDNVRGFYRKINGKNIKVTDGTILKLAEDYTDRYVNVAYSGLNYAYFPATQKKPVLVNTRVYSMTLVNNAIPFRWRSVYNDDTDVCLRALKAGWCTLLFCAFVGGKCATMTVKGGNTEQLYVLNNGKDGRLLMAEALQKLHPDVTKVRRRFGRWQHVVNYRSFQKNKLLLKNEVSKTNTTNDYGMKLQYVK